MKRLALGKVAKESYQDFNAYINAAIEELQKMGAQEREGLKPENELPYQSYKALNALGFYYSAALVRSMISDLDPSSENFPEQLSSVARDLDWLYHETTSRYELRDESVIRQAAHELPDVLPSWMNLDEILAAGQASYGGKGVYIRDFYNNVLTMIGEVWRAFRRFAIENGRPELVSFRREGTGGDYIPTALLQLDEEEEQKLLKTVIQEANRRISRLTFYGPREEPIPSGDFTIIRWSNGPERWFWDNLTEYAVFTRSRGVKSIKLDANQALVPFHPSLVNKVIEALDDIPLYVYSLEAKERGDYPEPTDRNVRMALRSIIEPTVPDIDPEDLTLLALEKWNLLQKAKAGDRAAQVEFATFIADHLQVARPYMRLIEEWTQRRR